ncbi:hypothetical protein K502DRAFT_135807 [Neoconidiobolus thromboides FSU 785]|nr:hypothetical protein K502DRAFT_135807 [Neoconidiobolus thromboides FSU 785]
MPLKLPAKGESWNFSPVQEHQTQNGSYFDNNLKSSEKRDSSLPQLIEVATSPVLNPTQSINIINSNQPITSENTKKSRFVLDNIQIDKNENINSENPPDTTLSQVRKGRFALSDDTPESASTNLISPYNTDFVGQLPLSREASKSSRFSISSEVEATSPAEPNNEPSRVVGTSSFSKRGRFQLSNEAGGVNTNNNDDKEDNVDQSNTLMMHANQLDLIAKQNEKQRNLLIELHSKLQSGNLSTPQLKNIETNLNEQSKANSKFDDFLSDSMITFQQLTQQILQQNQQLKVENERLNLRFEKLGNNNSENSTVSKDVGMDVTTTIERDLNNLNLNSD